MTTANQILATVLNCGTGDIDFLIKQLSNFDADFSDVWDDCKGLTETPEVNEIYNSIYQSAISKVGIDEDAHEVKIFTNSIDSHLYIDDEEMYAIDDIKAFKERNENA